MFNFLKKKYRILSVYGGTLFVPVYYYKKSSGYVWIGISKNTPDIQALALTHHSYNKKQIADMDYGVYIGSHLDNLVDDHSTIAKCSFTSLSDAKEAIDLHKRFVHFKNNYKSVKVVEYVR